MRLIAPGETSLDAMGAAAAALRMQLPPLRELLERFRGGRAAIAKP
jgi:hypothetical protein